MVELAMETERKTINNAFYDSYGDRWYTAQDDPVALLRAENHIKVPWVVERIVESGIDEPWVLDVGCGGGFLTNALALEGFSVEGVDISPESIRTAREHDHTGTVQYGVADAYDLPFQDESFDVVTTMDFLEHVEDPEAIIKECARVLKPGGMFFFHTFNRNPLSHLIVIKFLEWFVKNTPKNMHVIELFIKPEELHEYCLGAGLTITEMTGIKPVISSISPRILFDGKVPHGMKFELTESTLLSYMGFARKSH